MPSRSSSKRLTRLEKAVLAHLVVLLLAGTWVLGGNAVWVRTLISWWGSLGILLTLAAALAGLTRGPADYRPLLWLWPWALFNALVLYSCLTPSFREVRFGSEVMLNQIALPTWPPNTAVPSLSLQGLWLFDGVFLSCFNLAFIVRRRRALRGLLLFCAGNAVALAIFGSIQQLVGAPGIFFGLIPSRRQPFFFASFIYHNHWGAYALLMIALCLALARHYLRRSGEAGLFSSPAGTMLLGALLLAATEPLSASRSCTLLLVPLLGVAALHWMRRIIQRRRHYNESAAGPIAAALVGGILAVAGIWYVAREVIVARIATSRDQIAAIRAMGGLGSRAILYRDTWRMAQDKLWFGWGMDSYPHVFMQYNTQEISPVDGLPNYYFDAHNDWLQSLAEHGVVGTLLLVLCPLAPLLALRRRSIGPLSGYLLGGCALLVFYSVMEFPFDNTGVVICWWVCFFSAVQYVRLSEPARPAPSP